jgi:hypothetical protein
MSEHPHATDATMKVNYDEAGLIMACIDHALCHSPNMTEGSLKAVRPLIDKLAATFGFPTSRLDRLTKGLRVRKMDRAF